MFKLNNILRNLKKTLSDLALMICRCNGINKIITSSTLTVYEGDTATIYAIGNDCAYSYQWQVLTNNVWTNIEGATNSTYTTPPLTLTTYYRLITSYNHQCYSISNTLTIDVLVCEALITCTDIPDCSIFANCTCGTLDCPIEHFIPNFPEITLSNCNIGCDITIDPILWRFIEVIGDPGEEQAVYGFSFDNIDCCGNGGDIDECFINTMLETILGSKCMLDCNSIYEECNLQCIEDGGLPECYTICQDNFISCGLSCLNGRDIPTSECCGSDYSATITYDIPGGVSTQCGNLNHGYYEVIGQFQDSLGNNMTCTIRYYDLLC